MIFHRIVLENMFSYHGQQILDLSPHPDRDPARRVVLIMGRNGYGKTSLLNAIKLLFLGSESKEQRDVGFPPRTLSRTDYVLGLQGGWDGILNLKARAEGITRCSVTVDLGPAERIAITARRSWDIASKPFREDIEVWERDSDHRVNGAAAEERLSEILPRELVPYFFFDGEEVQFLAQAGDDARSAAMERLLSLSYITGVEAVLGDVVKEWRRQEMPDDIRVQLTAKEGELGQIQARDGADLAHLRDRERDLTEAREALDQLRRRMDSLRSEGVLADTARLEADIGQESEALQQELSVFVQEVAADAPLLAVPGLVRAALPPLEAISDRKARQAEGIAETLSRTLPQRLFNEPPLPRLPLSDDQRRFYYDKLCRLLEAYLIEDEGPSFLSSLDLGQARRLRDRFRGLAASLDERRHERARHLKDISRRRARLEEMREEQREAQFGSHERGEQYRRLEDDFAAQNKTVGRIEKEIEDIQGKRDENLRQQEQIRATIKDLEKQYCDSEKKRDRLNTAIALRQAFQDYRRKNRERKRSQIEEAVNGHYRKLMTGHSLIHRIVIDDAFNMSFLDASGALVGRMAISHGMRQLAVTALLWALKDVSGRSLPMIVDTPLARIDRGNQIALIEKYYPCAADQVIVLATDSEIDKEKEKVIMPFLDRCFALRNPGGQSTELHSGIAIQGVNHGD